MAGQKTGQTNAVELKASVKQTIGKNKQQLKIGLVIILLLNACTLCRSYQTGIEKRVADYEHTKFMQRNKSKHA